MELIGPFIVKNRCNNSICRDDKDFTPHYLPITHLINSGDKPNKTECLLSACNKNVTRPKMATVGRDSESKVDIFER